MTKRRPRTGSGDPNGNPHITGGSHPKCEKCKNKVAVQFTNYGAWYHCKSCGHTHTLSSTEQVSEL